MTRPSAKSMRSQSGVALVSVLWVVILLTVIASTMIAMTVSHGKSMQAARARLEADQTAEAGIALALAALGDPHGGWPVDGTRKTVRFGDVEVQVSVTAESGKIDLNTGDRTLIRGLLIVEGAGAGDAETISDAIQERRSPEWLQRLNGVADGDSGQAGAAGFESISALRQVPGMRQSLYDRVAPNVTLYSGSSSVDVSVASADVILSIPGNTTADAEAALRARTDPSRLGGGDLSRVIGHAFSVTATARLSGETVGIRREIVRLTGNPKEPVWVLWVE